MNRRELFRRAAGLAAAVGLTSKVGKAEAPRPAVTCQADAREAFVPLKEVRLTSFSAETTAIDVGRPGEDRTVEVRVRDGKLLESIERGSASVGFHPRKP